MIEQLLMGVREQPINSGDGASVASKPTTLAELAASGSQIERLTQRMDLPSATRACHSTASLGGTTWRFERFFEGFDASATLL
jgi:hypothetical protein